MPNLKPKHVPIRTCVACRTSDAKRGLLRVVRLADGSVVFDAKGKVAGRGAYVCAQVACIATARKQKKLDRSLKATVSDAVFSDLVLRAQAAGESAVCSGARSGQAPGTSIPAADETAPGVGPADSSAGEHGLDGGAGPRESEE